MKPPCSGQILRGSAGVLAVARLLLCTEPASAEQQFAIEFFIGTAVNFETPLKIQQAGEPDLDFSARYATKPFTQPIYWMFRSDWLRENSRWELQLTHHKLYLEDNPPEVQHFEITHGYNLVTVNRAFARAHFAWRVGAGAVIAHTESEVRGAAHSADNYELAGPAFLIGAGRSFYISDWFFLTPEIQLSVAWAKVSVADGFASGPNVAFHFVVGAGLLL